MKLVERMKAAARADVKRIVLPEGDEPRTAQAAAILKDEGIAEPILLTGGLIRFADIVEGIEKHCGFIAPVFAYPGEMEQEALALPTLKVLRGELTAQTYTGRDVWGGFGDIGL